MCSCQPSRKRLDAHLHGDGLGNSLENRKIMFLEVVPIDVHEPLRAQNHSTDQELVLRVHLEGSDWTEIPFAALTYVVNDRLVSGIISYNLLYKSARLPKCPT